MEKRHDLPNLLETMKHSALIALMFISSALPAQDLQEIPPMPVLPRPLPPHSNPAIYPSGRFEWFEKAKANIDMGKKVGSASQIVFDGDSITENWKNAGNEIWAQCFAPYGAVNFGIGGDRTQNLLWRLSQGQGEGMHPKLVILMIGTNNIRFPAEQIFDGVRAVVEAYRKRFPDSVILLQGILPREERPDDPLRATVKQVNDRLAGLADGKNLLFVDFGGKFLRPDGFIGRDIMPDFLHPNKQGYQIWADAIRTYIDKYLGAKPHAHPAADLKTNVSS